MKMVIGQASQFRGHILGLNVKRLVDGAPFGKDAHGAAASYGVDAATGRLADCHDASGLNPELYGNAVAAAAHAGGKAVGVGQLYPVLGVAGMPAKALILRGHAIHCHFV